MGRKIPVSAIVVTRDEGLHLQACLHALSDFAAVWVIDSTHEAALAAKTRKIAQDCGAIYRPFVWNGQYPKKRQWCLDHLPLAHDWVLFVDADEILTPELRDEITALDYSAAGYFIRGRYVWGGKTLRFGLKNNKLALFNHQKMTFPVLDDLGFPGMGEIEGHYQPVRKPGYRNARIGQLKAPLIHDAARDMKSWEARHERYALWYAKMNEAMAWPPEPSVVRRLLKAAFRAAPLKPLIVFLHSYVLKFGFIDGRAGLDFALSRLRFYQAIESAGKFPAPISASASPRFAPHK